MSEHERLFDEFTNPTYDEWRTAAEKTLKGAAFEKKLITKTYEGIDLQPMYRREDAADVPYVNTLPGFPPYVRSTNACGYAAEAWDICQGVPYATAEAVNESLRKDIERGQTAINLMLDRATMFCQDADTAGESKVGIDGMSLSCADDLAKALDGIDITQCPVFIPVGVAGLPIIAMVVAHMQQKGQSPDALRGCIGMDPLTVLATTGTLPCSLDTVYLDMAVQTSWAHEHAPQVQTILVQGSPYHDAGGSATQELAFALATGVEYMRELLQRGLAVDDVAPHIRFAFSVGSNFFMEVAKLRAARLLWAKVVVACGGSETAQKMFMHVRTSAWNKTVYDPFVNMLRTTTETFAGIVGGCNSLYTSCFDEPLAHRQPDFFSRRIARNTQIILRDESHLTRVIDPAGGSWYVEKLTDSVARKAWELFQEVERHGGMCKALEEGLPQIQIQQTADQRAKSIAQRRDIFVGTNMYPNLTEKPLERNTPDYDALQRERASHVASHRQGTNQERCKAACDTMKQKFADAKAAIGNVSVATACIDAAVEAVKSGATVGDIGKVLGSGDEAIPSTQHVLQLQRGARLFEALRENADAYATRTGSRPKVFLANMGPIPQHKPRADFSIGFLEVGGFEVLRNNGFPTIEEAAKAALESQAPIVVICSTDDTYPELVSPLTQLIKQDKSDTIVLLAGYPQDQVESHKAAGVDDFIHLRANCYDMLASLQKKIGVSNE